MNGMPSSPAASRVASRRSGVLSGAPRWQARSGLSDSSIIPCDAATGRSRASSADDRAPALAWGRSPVSASTNPAHGHQVVDGGPVAGGVEPVPRHRVAVLGLLAQGEQGLVTAGGGAVPGDGQNLLGRQVRGFHPGRGLGEGAVAAQVAAQPGQRDEDLGRERDAGARGRVPDAGSRSRQLLERRGEKLGARHTLTTVTSFTMGSPPAGTREREG